MLVCISLGAVSNFQGLCKSEVHSAIAPIAVVLSRSYQMKK